MRRKSKRIKILLIGIVLLAIIIAGIFFLVKKISNKPIKNDPNKPVETDKSIVYNLPSTKYNGMDVTNVELEYMKENKQTMVTMKIKNTSGKPLEHQQTFNVRFYNAEGIELLTAGTLIEPMGVDEETFTSLILTGDFTSIKKVILEDIDKTSESESESESETETTSSTEETNTNNTNVEENTIENDTNEI